MSENKGDTVFGAISGLLAIILTIMLALHGLTSLSNSTNIDNCKKKHDVYACKWIAVPVEQPARDNPNKEGTN